MDWYAVSRGRPVCSAMRDRLSRYSPCVVSQVLLPTADMAIHPEVPLRYRRIGSPPDYLCIRPADMVDPFSFPICPKDREPRLNWSSLPQLETCRNMHGGRE